MITKEEIDAAYDALEAAFRALAEAEDRYSEIESELSSVRSGSPRALRLESELQAAAKARTEAARAWRLAGMRVDRLNAHLALLR